MKLFLLRLVLNIVLFLIGLLHLGEAKRDIRRELPKWFCYLQMITSYATILFSFSVWFWT
jgi:hypothetical protein